MRGFPPLCIIYLHEKNKCAWHQGYWLSKKQIAGVWMRVQVIWREAWSGLGLFFKYLFRLDYRDEGYR